LALFFQIAFQPVSDFELRASDFRPKAGFGFSTPSAGLGAKHGLALFGFELGLFFRRLKA